jgi:hypothetical protein
VRFRWRIRRRGVPVIINVRDRLTPLRQLVGWLETAGVEEIYLLDNASTYPPLLDYLDSSPHRVISAGGNLGHQAPWISGTVARVAPDRRYVVTDPDVVPDEECPLDALERFGELLDRYDDICYVGFGLRIDDLPEHYRHRDQVRQWEAQFWVDEVEPGVYRADIDTTFALYEPGVRRRGASLRTGPPYVARHLPWYADTDHPTEEDRYYRDHLDPGVNTWDQETLPPAFERRIADR